MRDGHHCIGSAELVPLRLCLLALTGAIPTERTNCKSMRSGKISCSERFEPGPVPSGNKASKLNNISLLPVLRAD
jgi:hypothetical protein